jgi:hypothetical protein
MSMKEDESWDGSDWGNAYKGFGLMVMFFAFGIGGCFSMVEVADNLPNPLIQVEMIENADDSLTNTE